MSYRYNRQIRRRERSRYPNPVPQEDQIQARLKRVLRYEGEFTKPQTQLIAELEEKLKG